MKTQALRITATMSGAVLAFAGCEPKTGIVILPENNDEQKKFEAHWKDINDVLTKSSLDGTTKEDLYFIKDYSQGKLLSEHGKLLEVFRVREIEQPKVASDFTGHAFQIGLGLKYAKPNLSYIGEPKALPRISPTPKEKWGEWPHLHLNKKIKESAQLVEAVDDILKKPTPTPTPTPTPEP